MGNEVVRMPFLDSLARDAVVFDNAYSPDPVCIPARQCMAAGQYARHCRVEHFGEDLAPNYQTLPRIFGHSGYKTVQHGEIAPYGSRSDAGMADPAGRRYAGGQFLLEIRKETVFYINGMIGRKSCVPARANLPMPEEINWPFRRQRTLFMKGLWMHFMTGQIRRNRYFCMSVC